MAAPGGWGALAADPRSLPGRAQHAAPLLPTRAALDGGAEAVYRVAGLEWAPGREWPARAWVGEGGAWWLSESLTRLLAVVAWGAGICAAWPGCMAVRCATWNWSPSVI